jgi:pimeloyl-ACP methyl ester carboxylesterase
MEKAVSSSQSQIVINEQQLSLSTGVSAQVFSSTPQKATQQPPLVFIHGSFHAAWCWTEKYFPFYVNLGYPVAALSLRGTGGTFAGEGVKKVKLLDHTQDLRSFLTKIPGILGGNASKKPIVICHSFGGLALMKYLELHTDEAASQLGGLVFMCSVPPSGNGKLTLRYLSRSLVDSWKITAGFAMKRCIHSEELCRELFFGGVKGELQDGNVDDFGVSDEDIRRYQQYFARDTVATIDLANAARNLPSFVAVNGVAPFASKLPPTLVMGAERDFIVDREGVEETAKYLGAGQPIFVDSPHDVMLGRNWQNAANVIHNWIKDNGQ